MRSLQWAALLNASLYALLGLLIYALSLVVLARVTPFDLRREIVEQKNVALALLVGLVALGLAMIVAVAVH